MGRPTKSVDHQQIGGDFLQQSIDRHRIAEDSGAQLGIASRLPAESVRMSGPENRDLLIALQQCRANLAKHGVVPRLIGEPSGLPWTDAFGDLSPQRCRSSHQHRWVN